MNILLENKQILLAEMSEPSGNQREPCGIKSWLGLHRL